MYSSGLPILYPIACLFYTLAYWVYKTLLLKYYQRTSKFNERLALYSVGYVKYGLLFHMVVGGLMYTNSNIMSTSNADRLESAASWLRVTGHAFLAKRFSSLHAQLYMGLLTVLVLAYLLKRFIVQLLAKLVVLSVTCPCLR